MTDLEIDPDFRDALPELDTDEFQMLQEQVQEDGCREALVVWRGFIIDGHNRYNICKSYGIPFNILDYTDKFQTKEEAIDWMLRNQLGKRNLKPLEITYIRGELYNRRKNAEGGSGANQYINSSQQLRQNDVVPQETINISTASEVATEQHVSSRTVERDAAFSKAVNTLAKNTGIESLKRKILDGKVKATRADIIAAATVPDVATQARVMEAALSRETNVKTLLNEEKRQQEITARAEVVVPVVEPTGVLDLRNMDCLEYMVTLPDKSVDLLLTDPPYEISRDTGFSQMTNGVQRLGVSMDFGQWDNPGSVDLPVVLKEAMRVLKNGGTAIIFYDLWKITPIRDMMVDAGFKQLRIIEWLKDNPVPLNSKINYLTNAREIAIVGIKGSNPKFHSEYDNGVYHHPIYQSRHRFHPTQKPVELMCELIEKHTDEGDVVLDVFLGSGTTAVAAIKKNRKCKGCEIDPLMYTKMMERIEDVQR